MWHLQINQKIVKNDNKFKTSSAAVAAVCCGCGCVPPPVHLATVTLALDLRCGMVAAVERECNL